MTEKINVDQLKEAAKILQDIKNGIGTNDNKLRMESFYTLNSLNQIIGRLEMITDHQPTFEVGEYYSSDNGKKVFKIFGNADDQIEYCVYDTQYSTLKNWLIPEKDIVAIFPDSISATAEQIAEFKRAEHFAAHRRKLDEFRVGDKVSVVGEDEIVKIESLRGDSSFGGVSDLGNYFIISTPSYYGVTLIQTAEELREVADNAD